MQLVAWKLRDILAAMGISQRELGKRYELGQGQISKCLNGKHFPESAIQKIDEDYADLFGQDASPANPLPARMTRRLRDVPPNDLHRLLSMIDAFLTSAE